MQIVNIILKERIYNYLLLSMVNRYICKCLFILILVFKKMVLDATLFINLPKTLLHVYSCIFTYFSSVILCYLVYFLLLQLSTKNNDMMTSALTTLAPQNNTTKNTSSLSPTTVQNALSTSFGTSADKDVQDNKLSTNTAEITTTTSSSLQMDYNMQFMEAETSTHIVQNSPSLDSLAFSVEQEEKGKKVYTASK